MNKYVRNAILAVVLAVVAFFWIWFFDYLLAEKPVEAIPRAITTLFGVVLSLLIGMLLAALLDAVLSPGRDAKAAEAPALAEQ